MNNFWDSLERGEAVEDMVFDFFRKHYDIDAPQIEGDWRETANTSAGTLQRLGIDAVFTHRKTGSVFTVEVKSDFKTHETGNVFLELEDRNKPSWTFTCGAQRLLYAVVYPAVDDVPMMLDVYAYSMCVLRDRIAEWRDKHRTAPAWTLGRDGRRYKTLGLIVPVTKFAEHARGHYAIDTAAQPVSI